MTRRLTEKEIVDVINAYTVDMAPMIDLAKRYDRTRQGIWKLLKSKGIEPADYERMEVSCSACGEQFSKPRCQIRDRRHLFCDKECYFAFIEAGQAGKYQPSRQGQRVGRAVVSNYFALEPGNVVHHIDRNSMNNHPSNLMVFANNGDHVRHHRWSAEGIKIDPLWDGSQRQ